MDAGKAERYLYALLQEMKEARKRWCGEEADDAEEMWTEYPGVIKGIISEVEDILGLPPSGLKIISAEYGAGTNMKDVKAIVKDHRSSYYHLSVNVNNNEMKGDPAPNTHKTLKVVYTFNGVQKEMNVDEGGTLSIMEEQ